MAATRFLKRLPGAATSLLSLGVRMYASTLRVRVVDSCKLLDDRAPPATIYLVWHDRLLFLPALTPKSSRTNCAVLVSHSRDGGYITDLLERLGYDAVRGSSSKGGLAALRSMKRRLDDGKQIVITPDGPRGPAFAVHKGAIWLARGTGARVVPLSLNMHRPWRLRGWDGTQVPKPFSRGELVVGEALRFTKNDSEEDVHGAISKGLYAISGDRPESQ
ncbi:MAG: lysophospholipid acyltransferase (LPLAT)-like uncharacterized protein [Rhodothermales bacterium]|jgi:lysophospholipid acyltransferase (LPLAT)-like uncharacterized protein